VPELKAAGVALHAITCETGGDAALKARLADRKCADLPFQVHCDPDANLCVKPGDDFFITERQDAGAKFGGDYVGVDYLMVQPALVIVDSAGAVVRKWSWHSYQPPLTDMSGLATVTIDGKSIYLVAARPLSADILPAIREGRDVRLSCALSFPKAIQALIREKVPLFLRPLF